jgi:Putative adhesin
MKKTRNGRSVIQSGLRRIPLIWLKAGIALATLAASTVCVAQTSAEFHKSLPISNAEPVVLSVEMRHGDVEILYSRDGQVSITAVGQAAGESMLGDNFFLTTLAIEQSGNHVTLRQISNAVYSEEKIKVRLRIDVPYRTEVNSIVAEGKQTIRGVLGPVQARSGKGDIKASYVSKTLRAATGKGNVELQMIGEHVDAKVVNGNISGERLPQGITSETRDGDITLMVVGPSTATVVKGSGRIDVGGARGSLALSTDAGDLHVVAVPHDGWKLNSESGTIRLDLPPVVNVALNASTDSGKLQLERDDIPNAGDRLREVDEQPNSKKPIDVHTGSGSIVIR